MEQKSKFRLHLNLFDGIVLVLALAVGALLIWSQLKPQEAAEGAAPTASTVRYTVRFQKWAAGDSQLIQPGDVLVDNIKNFDMGQVVSAEAVPAKAPVVDQVNRRIVQASVPGYEDVLVTVESECTESETGPLLGGGYELHVGAIAYIRGAGYMASGPIVAIEREEQA